MANWLVLIFSWLQADGHTLETIEGLAHGLDLHPIQLAFINTGAIQSGYATPAMVLAAKALLAQNPNPTEAEIRDALSGILDRETGYVKPVQAIRARPQCSSWRTARNHPAQCPHPHRL